MPCPQCAELASALKRTAKIVEELTARVEDQGAQLDELEEINKAALEKVTSLAGPCPN